MIKLMAFLLSYALITRCLAFLSSKQAIDNTAQLQITATIGQLDVAGKNAMIAAATPPKPKRKVPANEEAVPAILG